MVTRNLTIYLSFLILEYTNSEQNKRKRELNVGRIIEQCGKLLCLLTIRLQWDSKCNKYIIQTRFCPTGKEDFKKEQKKKKLETSLHMDMYQNIYNANMPLK